MEAPTRALLEEWMARWDDLVRFEVVDVVASAEAAAAVARLPGAASRGEASG